MELLQFIVYKYPNFVYNQKKIRNGKASD